MKQTVNLTTRMTTRMTTRIVMRLLSTSIGTLALTLTSISCARLSNQNSEQMASGLRVVTPEERAQDFDQLLSLFKSYYGPYQYKEQNLKINIEKIASELKAKAVAAKTDEEFAGTVMQFSAALRDGHVQFTVENTSSRIARYKVPIFAVPIEGKVLIGDIQDTLKTATGFSVGDEILEVDGKPPLNYLPTILKYRSVARDQSNLHLVSEVLSRHSYLTEMLPTSPLVQIKVRTANGVELAQEIPWQVLRYNEDTSSIIYPLGGPLDLSVALARDLNSITGSLQMGEVEPFFVTASSQKKFNFVKVYPDDVVRKAFGLADAEKPPIYAALYRYSGKTILLVREASYAQADFGGPVYLKAYMALLSQYQDLADVLVIDQTHNPGGSYCASFYNIFARDGDHQAAELLHADRKWIDDLETKAVAADPKKLGTWDDKTGAAWAAIVERSYDARASLSAPIPLFTGSFASERPQFQWTKPMLVLIDELAGSCGDIFPMLVQSNHRAKLFGTNTMGLGGNVEQVGTLTNSRIDVRLTRGMFYPYIANQTPQPGDFIENNGVAAEYQYDHTVSDFRAGFIGYVDAFSAKAIEQIK